MKNQNKEDWQKSLKHLKSIKEKLGTYNPDVDYSEVILEILNNEKMKCKDCEKEHQKVAELRAELTGLKVKLDFKDGEIKRLKNEN